MKDELACGDSGLIFTVDDLNTCKVEQEDPFYAVVLNGEVRIYREDPGPDRPISFDIEPCV